MEETIINFNYSIVNIALPKKSGKAKRILKWVGSFSKLKPFLRTPIECKNPTYEQLKFDSWKIEFLWFRTNVRFVSKFDKTDFHASLFNMPKPLSLICLPIYKFWFINFIEFFWAFRMQINIHIMYHTYHHGLELFHLFDIDIRIIF